MPTLDDYLDQLGREIQGSPEDTADILREIRSHLELAVQDPECNGLDDDCDGRGERYVERILCFFFQNVLL